MAKRLKQLRQEESERLASGEDRADELEARTDDARQSFDAAEYAREVGRAQFEDLREQLGRDVESLRGNQVGRGRLDTGFGMQDEDRMVGDAYQDLDRALASNAFQAAGMNLRNIEGGQDAAENARERDYQLMAGATDREQARVNEKRRERRKRFGLLGGIAGGAIGLAVGQPAVGAEIGSAIGNTI